MTDFHRTAIMPILRWIWLLPAIYLAQLEALFTGVALHARPGGFAISRAYHHAWWRACGGALPRRLRVADPRRMVVTRVVFIGGCAVALYLTWLTAPWDSFLAAVTA